MTEAKAAVDPELLEILRCPVAVHYKDIGSDPGQLELYKDCWLLCADSGYKYPIVDGHPHHASRRGRQVEGHREGVPARAPAVRRPPVGPVIARP